MSARGGTIKRPLTFQSSQSSTMWGLALFGLATGKEEAFGTFQRSLNVAPQNTRYQIGCLREDSCGKNLEIKDKVDEYNSTTRFIAHFTYQVDKKKGKKDTVSIK